MNTAALIMTSDPNGLAPMKKLNQKIEDIPYEKFPFCCGGAKQREGSSVERETNLSKSVQSYDKKLQHRKSSSMTKSNKSKSNRKTGQGVSRVSTIAGCRQASKMNSDLIVSEQ